ncbi:MAG: hypothetical protein OEQ90_08660 [Gammaproteobacteria bacterium]|nr:hypothetical protein [Gammaproteobacteria bacterium]
MPVARCMSFVIVGTLLSAASLADDARTQSAESDQSATAGLSLDALYLEPMYSSRWRLSHPIETMAYSSDWAQPIEDIDFQDAGAFSRVKRIRALSLLTLAEGKGTRLFFGVDKEGTVGIHFRGLPRYGDDRCLEVVRMPYLKKSEPDSELSSSQD